MKKEIILFLVILNCLFFTSVKAQQTQGSPQQEVTKSITDYDGTFQVIFKQKVQEIFPINLGEIVESKRHDTDLVLFEYSEFTTLRIFPKSMINDPNWQPVGEIFIYETE